jgi:hypothetical protein
MVDENSSVLIVDDDPEFRNSIGTHKRQRSRCPGIGRTSQSHVDLVENDGAHRFTNTALATTIGYHS